MRIALVHDWLTGMRGGERCLESFIRMYPSADVFTLLHLPGTTSELIDQHVVGVSSLQKWPFGKRAYRYYFPLFPLAINSIDLRGYDVVISLSHAAAKNVRVDEQACHICYCFTPMRYLWDQAQVYFGDATFFLAPLLKALQAWDRRGAGRVDEFVAISRLVAARIRKFYNRDSHVVYPAIDPLWFEGRLPSRSGEAFLYAGALVPYKRVDLIIEACRVRKVPLWIVGSGPLENSLRAKAGKDVQFFGRVDDEQLRNLYANCRALLFAGKEDFGMIPVECQATGRPVVGFYEGGLKETVVGLKSWLIGSSEADSGAKSYSGVFVKPSDNRQQAVASLVAGIDCFIDNENDFMPTVCRAFARRFSLLEFYAGWNRFLRSRGLYDLCTAEFNIEEKNVKREAASL
jgi:glycosyltransferase involved in cell wall biosynthesis